MMPLLTALGKIESRTERSSHPGHVIYHWIRTDHREPGVVDVSFFIPKSDAELNVGDIVQVVITRAAITKAGAA